MTDPDNGAHHDGIDARVRNRNRLVLLSIVALFTIPILIAGTINWLGQAPKGTKQRGDLLDPPVNLNSFALTLADGSTYAWDPVSRTRRLLIVAPAACDEPCQQMGVGIEKVWLLMGKDAPKVDVIWMCPSGACQPARAVERVSTLRIAVNGSRLGARLRGSEAIGTVFLIDPNGFAVLRYAPGFDPAGLRADLAKLLKLK